jgi:hypothetical protein
MVDRFGSRLDRFGRSHLVLLAIATLLLAALATIALLRVAGGDGEAVLYQGF